MSLREYKALAVDCDGPGEHGDGCCDSTIYDAVEMSTGLVEDTLGWLGWLYLDGKHYCPRCRSNIVPKAVHKVERNY